MIGLDAIGTMVSGAGGQCAWRVSRFRAAPSARFGPRCDLSAQASPET